MLAICCLIASVLEIELAEDLLDVEWLGKAEFLLDLLVGPAPPPPLPHPVLDRQQRGIQLAYHLRIHLQMQPAISNSLLFAHAVSVLPIIDPPI